MVFTIRNVLTFSPDLLRTAAMEMIKHATDEGNLAGLLQSVDAAQQSYV